MLHTELVVVCTIQNKQHNNPLEPVVQQQYSPGSSYAAALFSKQPCSSCGIDVYHALPSPMLYLSYAAERGSKIGFQGVRLSLSLRASLQGKMETVTRKPPEKTLCRGNRRSVELLEDLLSEGGCLCPPNQDHKTAAHELCFFELKNMSKPFLAQAIAFFSMALLANQAMVLHTEWKAARYQPMCRSESTSVNERNTYAW